jgi:uncharacterized protein (TIGR03437 family)
MNTNFLLLSGLSLIAYSSAAAEFQNGQAARAVIGQVSFSSVDSSITPTVLSLSGGHLFAADASHRLLTFDLAQIPGPRDEPASSSGLACSLCGFTASTIANQSVLPGIAAITVSGKTIVAADPQHHRVLIWRDSSSPRAAYGPDVQLGRSSDLSPVSGSTLVNPMSVAFDGKRLFVGDSALHRVLIWNSLPLTDTQAADVVLGQADVNSSTLPDVPAADSINQPTSLVSDGTNLFVADSFDHRILIFTAADLPLAASSVMNSASLRSGPAAPGTLLTVSGVSVSSSGNAPPEGSAPLPTKLGGVEVFLNGSRLPLLSTSHSDIQAQLPYSLDIPSSASLYVRLETTDGNVTVTNAVALKLTAVSPGLFALPGPEPRGGVVLHSAADSTSPGTPVTPQSPAHPGETLIVWTAGLGAVDDGEAAEQVVAGQPFTGPDAPVLHSVAATVGGRLADVTSAQLPEGATGIYQVRLVLPQDLPDDPQTPLTIWQEGVSSNTVTIPVRNSNR